jgi:glycosyltransferase involved in cell wall biosynthesis
MRFHLLGLAHLPVKTGLPMCPFTPLIYGMSKFLTEEGHQVILYAPHGSDAPCTEFVEVVSKETISPLLVNYMKMVHRQEHPEWQEYKQRVVKELTIRYKVGDIALLTYGNFQTFVMEIAKINCEIMVGYEGFCSPCKVFPSNAWMHYLYGKYKKECLANWYDQVIPHYLDLTQYPNSVSNPEEYYLFLGRLISDKGIDVALRLCEDKKLIVGGCDHTGGIPDWSKDYPKAQFLGPVGLAQKISLLSKAKALLVPSQFLEPFGMVILEAMACGCPVITTDWGSFPEIVEQGVTGFRCRSKTQFRNAMEQSLNREQIRQKVAKYDVKIIGQDYLRYFERLQKASTNDWWNI